MNVGPCVSLRSRMVLAIALASATLNVGWNTGKGAEPQPPALPRGPDQAKGPSLLGWGTSVVIPGGLLEEIPPPPLVLWNDRPLYELRVRLLADEAQRQRRLREQQPGVNQWRATYGGVAPLALEPQSRPKAKDGTFGVYQAEVERLNQLMSQRKAGPNDFFLRGLIGYDVGRYREAARDFDQAIRGVARPSLEWLAMRGLAALAAGDPESALRDLDEAVRLDANVRNLNNRGVILAMLGRTQEALRDFDSALGIRQFTVKTSSVLLNRARTYSDLGKHDQAIEELKAFLNGAADPEAVIPANYLQGMIYRRMGQYRMAGRCYDLVIQLRRADDAMSNGLPSGSAIKKMPTDATLLDALIGEETAAEALVGRGLAHYMLEQTGPAIQDFTKAIRMRPRLVQAYVNRAVAYVRQGDVDLAEKDLEDALARNPRSASAWFNRGWLHLLQGRDAEAGTDLRRCVELDEVLRPRVRRLYEEVEKARQQAASGPQEAATQPPPASRPQYRAATPEAAIRWLQDARQAEDNDAVLQVLAEPIGNRFRKLYKAAERADQAHRNYMEVRNRQAGSFAEPSQWPISLQEQELRQLQEQRKFVVQSMTILDKKVLDEQGQVVLLTVRSIKVNQRGERQAPKEVFVAVRQDDDWKLMTLSTARLNAEGRKAIRYYFDQQIRRLHQMRKIMEDATRLRLAGKSVNDLTVALALVQVYKDFPLPGKTGDEPQSLEQVVMDTALMMSPYGQGLQQLYLYNRAVQSQQPSFMGRPSAVPR